MVYIFGCKSFNSEAFMIGKIDTIINSEKSYLLYYSQNMKFNDSTKYFQKDDSLIDARFFFNELAQGRYFPLKSENGNEFKLVYIKDWPISEVQGLIQGVGLQQLNKVKLIGKTLINGEFETVDKKIFDSTFIKDKIVFAKFWFIKCVPCVAEMPELNQIVLKNQSNKEFIFLSFAFDKRDALIDFLSKNKFSYEVFPVPESYVFDTLGIQSFPTHLLVINNKIIKIIKGKTEIISLIEKYKHK